MRVEDGKVIRVAKQERGCDAIDRQMRYDWGIVMNDCACAMCIHHNNYAAVTYDV